MLASGLTPKQLKQAGYKHDELLAAGVPLAELRAAGFKAKDAQSGASASELRKGGYSAKELKVLWLGSLLPRLLTTPNGSQWLPTAPYDYIHTLLLASNDSH